MYSAPDEPDRTHFHLCHAEFNDPALQDAESNQDKRNKWSCLDVVHRDAACRRKLSAVYRRHHIGPGKRDHINKEDKLKGVVYNLEECFTSAGKNCNKLLDFDGKTFLAAVADAQKAAPDKQISGKFLGPGQRHSKNISA